MEICLGPYIYIDDVIYDILPILIIPLIISYIKPNLPYLRYRSLNYQIFDKYYKQNAFLNNLYLLKNGYCCYQFDIINVITLFF